MSMNRVVDLVKTAEALKAMEFYVTKADNRDPELHCRTWALPALTLQEAEQLADLMNADTRRTRTSLQTVLINKAREGLKDPGGYA